MASAMCIARPKHIRYMSHNYCSECVQFCSSERTSSPFFVPTHCVSPTPFHCSFGFSHQLSSDNFLVSSDTTTGTCLPHDMFTRKLFLLVFVCNVYVTSSYSPQHHVMCFNCQVTVTLCTCHFALCTCYPLFSVWSFQRAHVLLHVGFVSKFVETIRSSHRIPCKTDSVSPVAPIASRFCA